MATGTIRDGSFSLGFVAGEGNALADGPVAKDLKGQKTGVSGGF
ncbi:MAG: hypothetical protein AB1490_11210 [Pseudomonadota bacterium]